MPTTMTVIGILVLLALMVGLSSIRIAREYERGVVFGLGRLIDLKGPGLFLSPADVLRTGPDRSPRSHSQTD